MCTNFCGFNFHGDACPRKLVPNENFCVYGKCFTYLPDTFGEQLALPIHCKVTIAFITLTQNLHFDVIPQLCSRKLSSCAPFTPHHCTQWRTRTSQEQLTTCLLLLKVACAPILSTLSSPHSLPLCRKHDVTL